MELLSDRTIINKLKEVKESRGLSATDIAKAIRKNGGNLSVTTIKRVFAKESEHLSFSHDYTIMPIAKALLRKNEAEEFPDAEMVKGMTAIINAQKDEIERLRNTNKRLEKDISFLHEQIEFKNNLIKQLTEFFNVAEKK